MQKTGGTIQVIAILVGILGILGIFFTTGSIAHSVSRSVRSSIWTIGIVMAIYHFISCTLLYAIGKIVEGIGDMKDSLNIMAKKTQNISSSDSQDEDEKLPTL